MRHRPFYNSRSCRSRPIKSPIATGRIHRRSPIRSRRNISGGGCYASLLAGGCAGGGAGRSAWRDDVVRAVAGAAEGQGQGGGRDRPREPHARVGGVFEINTGKQGKFRFKLTDAEGTTIAMCVRGYDTKAECQEHIDFIKKEAAKAKIDDQSKATDKKKTKD